MRATLIGVLLIGIIAFFSCYRAGVNSQSDHAPDSSQTISNMRPDAASSTQSNIDIFELPIISRASGTHFKAISVAYQAFLEDQDVPNDKKNIQNYRIELREDRANYYVYFGANRSKGDDRIMAEGGETSLGKSVAFVISKANFELVRRYFFK